MRQHIKEMIKDLYYDEKESLFNTLAEDLGKLPKSENVYIEKQCNNKKIYIVGGSIIFILIISVLYVVDIPSIINDFTGYSQFKKSNDAILEEFSNYSSINNQSYCDKAYSSYKNNFSTIESEIYNKTSAESKMEDYYNVCMDTCFNDTLKALDSLSIDEKKRYDNLTEQHLVQLINEGCAKKYLTK